MQGVQVTRPPPEYVPVAQAVFVVPEHAKPLGQGTHEVPVLENPGWHIKADMPVVVVCAPPAAQTEFGRHDMHADCPVRLVYVPAAQGVQVV